MTSYIAIQMISYLGLVVVAVYFSFKSGEKSGSMYMLEYLRKNNLDLKIEVETRSLDEVREAIDNKVDRIMFDNFSPDTCKEAVVIVSGRAETEASGGITVDTLKDYAETGVNYISIGALTHSVKALDISFKTKFKA